VDAREIDELKDPETWDDTTTDVLPPAKSPKAVVPVSFTPTEFVVIARFARAEGGTISQCIHDAILNLITQAEKAPQGRGRS
jgi:hypothetical protein